MHIKYSSLYKQFLTIIFLVSYQFVAIAADKGIIAYVSSSIDNKEIHLINPDSTQDRVLWSAAYTNAHVNDRIGALSWHPDGTELAFDSAHNWQSSTSLRDIYAISPDGTNYRNITNAPGAEGSNNFPTGSVKFTVGAREQGDVQIYIEGAKEPTKYFAKQSMDYTITQTIADWGEGVRQYIRLWDPGQISGSVCGFSEEGWVDIIPNQEIDLGSVPFYSTSNSFCYGYNSPSWSQDGNELLFHLGDLSANVDIAIKKISSNSKMYPV